MIGALSARKATKEELAEWQLDNEPVAWPELRENAFGEAATLQMADVQLGAVVVMGRIGKGEVAPVAVRKQDLEILASLESRSHAIGKAQGKYGNVGRRPDNPEHRCRQGLAQRRHASLDALGAISTCEHGRA
jgi:hypothetical protein